MLMKRLEYLDMESLFRYTHSKVEWGGRLKLVIYNRNNELLKRLLTYIDSQYNGNTYTVVHPYNSTYDIKIINNCIFDSSYMEGKLFKELHSNTIYIDIGDKVKYYYSRVSIDNEFELVHEMSRRSGHNILDWEVTFYKYSKKVYPNAIY